MFKHQREGLGVVLEDNKQGADEAMEAKRDCIMQSLVDHIKAWAIILKAC